MSKLFLVEAPLLSSHQRRFSSSIHILLGHYIAAFCDSCFVSCLCSTSFTSKLGLLTLASDAWLTFSRIQDSFRSPQLPRTSTAMPSLKIAILAVATALVSTVRADYYIEPDSVSLSLRQYWCSSEISTCPIICAQTAPFSTLTNTCDAVSL